MSNEVKRSFKFKKPGSGLNLNKKSIEVAELNIPSVPTNNNDQHKDFPCVPPKSSKQLGSYPSTQTKSCDQSRSYAITINDLDDDFDSALPSFKPTNQNVGTFNTTNQSLCPCLERLGNPLNLLRARDWGL